MMDPAYLSSIPQSLIERLRDQQYRGAIQAFRRFLGAALSSSLAPSLSIS